MKDYSPHIKMSNSTFLGKVKEILSTEVETVNKTANAIGIVNNKNVDFMIIRDIHSVLVEALIQDTFDSEDFMDYASRVNEIAVQSLLPEVEQYAVSASELSLSDENTHMEFRHLRKDKYALRNTTFSNANTEVSFSPTFLPDTSMQTVDLLIISSNRNVRNGTDSTLVGGTEGVS